MSAFDMIAFGAAAWDYPGLVLMGWMPVAFWGCMLVALCGCMPVALQVKAGCPGGVYASCLDWRCMLVAPALKPYGLLLP
jgi:hypothetical protein